MTTGIERMSKDLLALDAPCDTCDLRLMCKQEMACEAFAFWCGFFNEVKPGEPQRTIDECSSIPSKAMYLHVFPPDGSDYPHHATEARLFRERMADIVVAA